MKDLEKIFYGNIVAYDAALLPEAKQEELENVLWRWGIRLSLIGPCFVMMVLNSLL